MTGLSTSERYYRPELDVLRLVAFALVFLHHSAPRTVEAYSGFLSDVGANVAVSIANTLGYGLSLFFFLSAFLITELLMREKASTQKVDLKKFYIRRALRIWPLYFFGIAIGVVIAIGGHFIHPASNFGNPAMLVMYLLLAGNWFHVTAFAVGIFNPMMVMWSISVEEQFYLFWPLLIGFLSRRLVGFACVAMVLTAMGVQYYLGERSADTDLTTWYNSFVQFEMFGAGAALALLLKGTTPKFKTEWRIALVALAFMAWFISAHVFKAKYVGPALSGPHLVVGYALIAVGCGCVMLSLLGLNIKFPKPVIFLGRISFGLYVYHILAMTIGERVAAHILPESQSLLALGSLKALIAIVLTAGMAVLSYRFLESPFLRLKEKFAVVQSRPI